MLNDLFVPDANAINLKLSSIKDKFAFANDINSMFSSIKEYLIDSGTTVPKITINLGSAEGKYNYGGSALVLDMKWYSRYKPIVDLIIIAFVYINFIFLIYKRLPDIISGAGAITERFEDVGKGYRSMKRNNKGGGGGD